MPSIFESDKSTPPIIVDDNEVKKITKFNWAQERKRLQNIGTGDLKSEYRLQLYNDGLHLGE